MKVPDSGNIQRTLSRKVIVGSTLPLTDCRPELSCKHARGCSAAPARPRLKERPSEPSGLATVKELSKLSDSSPADIRPHGWRKTLVSYRKCVGAVQPGKSTNVSRRGICDRTIWKKPLAFAADAEGYKYMVWGFNGPFTISSPEPYNCRASLKRKVLAQQHVTSRRRKNLASAKTAASNTRWRPPPQRLRPGARS